MYIRRLDLGEMVLRRTGWALVYAID